MTPLRFMQCVCVCVCVCVSFWHNITELLAQLGSRQGRDIYCCNPTISLLHPRLHLKPIYRFTAAMSVVTLLKQRKGFVQLKLIDAELHYVRYVPSAGSCKTTYQQTYRLE